MSYRVIIPKPRRAEIYSWSIGREVLFRVLNRLRDDLADNHQDVCYRLAAPSPTFVYQLTIPDPQHFGFSHHFTFYLTYGEEDGTLVVQQAHHFWDEDRRDEEE